MKFCDKCNQLLVIKKNDKTKIHEYYCNNPKCDAGFYGMDRDILYVRKNVHNLSKIKMLAESAIQDDTFPSEERKCEKCKFPVMKWFRLDSNLKKIYVCEKCSTYYTHLS